jgi:hypothetical protein
MSGLFRTGPLIERAISNLDAAEANLLSFASAEVVLGQMPCLLRHVQCHLPPNDPRRQEFERIARKVGVKDPDHPLLENPDPKRPRRLDQYDQPGAPQDRGGSPRRELSGAARTGAGAQLP